MLIGTLVPSFDVANSRTTSESLKSAGDLLASLVRLGSSAPLGKAHPPRGPRHLPALQRPRPPLGRDAARTRGAGGQRDALLLAAAADNPQPRGSADHVDDVDAGRGRREAGDEPV